MPIMAFFKIERFKMEKYTRLLGKTAKDKVTGFEGVITSMCFDLYGCIQGIITAPVGKDGTRPDDKWFDMNRLVIKNKKPVMELPDFDHLYIDLSGKGAAEKPLPN